MSDFTSFDDGSGKRWRWRIFIALLLVYFFLLSAYAVTISARVP